MELSKVNPQGLPEVFVNPLAGEEQHIWLHDDGDVTELRYKTGARSPFRTLVYRANTEIAVCWRAMVAEVHDEERIR